MPGPLPRYLTVAVLVRLADEGARVALVLLGVARAGSPGFAGALVAAMMTPHVLAAPVVGTLVDRVRHKRLAHATALAGFGASLAAAAVLTGRVPGWVVIVPVAAGGCCSPMLTGGLSALLGDLARDGPDASGGAVARAYNLDAVSYTIAGVCGPSLAALVATAAGPGSATVVLALFVGTGALVLLTLPLRPAAPPSTVDQLPDRPWGGFGALWRDRRLRAVTVASTIGTAGVGALPVVAVLLAGPHHALAGGYVSALALGDLVGAVAYARWPFGSARPERTVVWSFLALTAPLAATAVAPGVLARVALLMASGLVTAPGVATLLTARARYAPTGLRTQVFTLGAGLKITGAAAGAALAGLAAGAGGTALLLAVAACQALAAGLGALALRTRERPPAPVSTATVAPAHPDRRSDREPTSVRSDRDQPA